jgi:hypothetical protein
MTSAIAPEGAPTEVADAIAPEGALTQVIFKEIHS